MNETYQQFNENLFSGLNPRQETIGVYSHSPQPVAESAPEAGQGYLTVQVTLAQQAIPIEGAAITISAPDNQGAVLARLVTDQSGCTPRLALPAPKASLSQAPGSPVRPYGVYDIQISYPGYYTETVVHVPIFDQVDSLQPISLRPLSQGETAHGEIFADESQAEVL